MSNQKLNLKQTIMEKINSGKIAMKPRWFFFLGSVAAFAGLIGLSVLAIFLINLLFFLSQRHGPNLSWRVQNILSDFPWWIPLLAVFSIAGGIFLLKRYDFSYKRNFIQVIGIFFLALLAAGWIVNATGINDLWERRGPMRGFYRNLNSQNNLERGNGRGKGNGTGHILNQELTHGTIKTLTPQAKTALEEAIQDEYKAHATYQKVIDTFGSTRPFSNIIHAEEQHIASLKVLFERYGLTVPNDEWANKVTAPATIQESCTVGVQAEIDNAKLYRDKLLPVVKDYSDITQTFTSLMNASQNNHLPAFQRCAE